MSANILFPILYNIPTLYYDIKNQLNIFEDEYYKKTVININEIDNIFIQ